MHGAAVYSLFSGFVSGTTQVLMRAFDPDEALQLIQDEKVSCAIVVGDAMARPLTDAIERRGASFDLSSLFMVCSGGALWSTSSKEQLLRSLPHLYLRDGFGASESGVDGTLATDASGVTRVRGNPTMSLVDDELRAIEPGSDELGYIARSGHVPLGYFNDEAKTAAIFPVVDGVRMAVLGDMGRIEADGAIVLLGRGSGCINTGGEKVFPEEVESVLKSHPAVMDAVVTGLPHERYGEQVSAVVQLRDVADIDTDDLARHCRTSIAGYKVPRSITLVVSRLIALRLDSRAMRSALNRLEDDPDLWVGVLTGAPTVFSAGTDIAERGDLRTERGGEYGIIRRERDTPLVDAVEGVALGGGLEIALACDAIVAARTATFGLSETHRGLVATSGALFRAARALPPNIARELLISGRTLTAARGHELGLVNEVTENGQALERALALAEGICLSSPMAVRETLRALRALTTAADDHGWQVTQRAIEAILASEDMQEGISAFFDKRAPRWQGR